jgi:hypothetical protein
MLTGVTRSPLQLHPDAILPEKEIQVLEQIIRRYRAHHRVRPGDRHCPHLHRARVFLYFTVKVNEILLSLNERISFWMPG